MKGRTSRANFAGLLAALLPFLGTSALAQHVLPPLPYAEDALEPHLGAKTLAIHYGKHHQGYLDNLVRLTAETPLATMPLTEVVKATAGDPGQILIFNNAAQVWNHTFFWQSMKPGGGGRPEGRLLAMIERDFGSYDAFAEAFLVAGMTQFGSGWAWLVLDGDTLRVAKTGNADTPLAHGQIPLLTCDVWEHAYYLDYQNRRRDFVIAFLEHLVNWEFAAAQLPPAKNAE
jgi:Fe-Mn family superoxide dismutase